MNPCLTCRCGFLVFMLASVARPIRAEAPAREGSIQLMVVERGGTQPTACRVHLRDAAGKPMQPPGLPFWKDHFVCDGRVRIELAPGHYRYEIERGPEY